MPIALSISINRKEFERQLEGQTAQLRYALAGALTNVARIAHAEVKKSLPVYVDKPTPFTAKAFLWEKATKQNLFSVVRIQPLQAEYLGLQITGGVRKPKGSSILEPVLNQVRRDRYGNLPRTSGGRQVKQFAVAPQAGHGSIFFGKPKGARWAGAAPGVWQRLGHEKSKKKLAASGKTKAQAKAAGGHDQLRRLATFERQVTYRPRFPFPMLVKNAVMQHWHVAADEALRKALGSGK